VILLPPDPSPEPAWFRALSRIKTALDTVRAVPLCSEIEKVERTISDEAAVALSATRWEELARLADELVELRRFKELVCR
jgi:hypothetical protein